MDHSTWIATKINDSVRNIAITAGVPPRTLATQLEKERITPENIIKIAEAFDIHPVGALIDTGYLNARWGKKVDPVVAAQQLTDKQITDEILRRLSEVRGDHSEFRTPVDELAQRRSNSSGAGVEGVPYGAVADSSPDEDALREQEEGDAD